MKAVRLVEVNTPLQVQEIPMPTVGKKDVLVRVRAAGICHSDAHYRSGLSPVKPLPMTLGHEIAGVIEQVGDNVSTSKVGIRVCLHYNITCGNCYHCRSGNEQFCPSCLMLGHHTNGGYAKFVVAPEENAIPLPDEIPFDQGATLMCASATSFHALQKSRLKAGERVAVFGVGGLGMSAVQLARAFGAVEVYAVDINEGKLSLAAQYGARPVNAKVVDPVEEILKLTNGRGVDVSLELIGLPKTMRQAVRCLGPLGRAVIAGLSNRVLEIDTYRELLGNEAEIIGSNDHLLQELPQLVEMARSGILDVSRVVTRTIPLDATAVNETLDQLEQFGNDVRTVIIP